MSNQITNVTTGITLDDRKARRLITDIKKQSDRIMKSFLVIGYDLIELKELYGDHEKGFYNRILEDVGIKKTKANNLMNVALRFGDPESKDVLVEYHEYNYSKLVEVLPLETKEIKENISPKDSVRDIKKKKKEIKNKPVQTSEQIALELENNAMVQELKAIEEKPVMKTPDIIEFYKSKGETTKSGTTYYKQVKTDWDNFCDDHKDQFKKIELLNSALVEYMKKYEDV